MNWIERINRAEEDNAGFTSSDCGLATDWVTCACGEQDPRIPRYPSGIPMDHDLMNYGGEFMDAVETNSWGKAKKILAQIEERSAEILAKVKP